MIAASILGHGEGSPWSTAVKALDQWVTGKSAAQLFRTNPLAVAAELGTDPDATVDAFLAGVIEGWFDLRWEYHCPHCDGLPSFHHRLSEARATDYCPLCNVTFRNELDQNVEVTFGPAPKLASFDSDEEAAFRQAPSRTKPDQPRLSGLGLVHRPLFQSHFSDEVLSADESLEIRHVALLFTDIKGSTSLYERLGDAKAYNLVREHFRVLFQAIQSRGGIVVKTIGDAVMASFRQGSAALEAALDVQATIAALRVPDTQESVVVKMGLHLGPAIAVTMNDRFDYFGQSVNRAARIQGLARDQEIFISDAVVADPSCRRLLASHRDRLRKWRTQLKGIEGDQIVYSVN